MALSREQQVEEYKQKLTFAAASCMADGRTRRRIPRQSEVQKRLIGDAVSAGLLSPFLILVIRLAKPLLWQAIVELAKEVVDNLKKQLDGLES